jgi:DNA processing protein
MNTNVWLRLLYLETFSAEKLFAILAQCIPLQDLVTFSLPKLMALGFTQPQAERWQTINDEEIKAARRWLEQPNHALVTILDADYPTLLKQISDPPIALFVQGDKSLLTDLQLAIVGSRNPSSMGKETAFAFASYLAGVGLIITSGLATGIDAAAHRGALDAGGKTIAVCGTGLNTIYPPRHRELAAQIATNGALISEFPLPAAVRPYHFPKRNRIISGLSLGVLVVEAARRSGSLITARLASEQGREVFAIPGSIHNPLARGCHGLIRQGAKLVETAADVLEELSPLANIAQKRPQHKKVEKADPAPTLDPNCQRLLSYIDYEPTPVDVLVARSGMKAEEVSSMLLLLELQSLIQMEAGGYRKINTNIK